MHMRYHSYHDTFIKCEGGVTTEGWVVKIDLEHVIPIWWNLLSTGTDPPANVGLVGAWVTVHGTKLVGRVHLYARVIVQCNLVEVD